LARSRRLDSLGIVGGEPLLHPQLAAIIRMIKSAGVSVELFSNGLLLDEQRLAQLKAAGLDIVFLHIDGHQNRPDLPLETGRLPELWSAKASAVAAAGIEVGLAITAYADAPGQIDDAVQFVLSSPHVDYLLVTHHRDVQSMGKLTGDLGAGISAKPRPNSEPTPDGGLTNAFVFERMRTRFGLLPFAYLGSNVSADDPRWLSYMIGATTGGGQPASWTLLQASAAERLFVAIHRRLRGRYPFYIPQSSGRFRLQLLLNALSGGTAWANLKLIARSLRPGRVLRAKRLLFQCPAELASDGNLIHCAHCPDATVRQGRLIPVCISDQVGSIVRVPEEQLPVQLLRQFPEQASHGLACEDRLER
jgi:hypothetical protein